MKITGMLIEPSNSLSFLFFEFMINDSSTFNEGLINTELIFIHKSNVIYHNDVDNTPVNKTFNYTST